MSAPRILYRARQFWHGIQLAPTAVELDRVRSVLNPAQFDIFTKMQPAEQSHSLAVLNRLSSAGESNQDLLVAALLHDVGKCLYPLKLWERVWIVIGSALLPHRTSKWSKGDPESLRFAPIWKRPFIVAGQHAQWGADMAERANSSALVVSLIRFHQDTLAGSNQAKGRTHSSQSDTITFEGDELVADLLRKLQAADNNS